MPGEVEVDHEYCNSCKIEDTKYEEIVLSTSSVTSA